MSMTVSVLLRSWNFMKISHTFFHVTPKAVDGIRGGCFEAYSFERKTD